MAKVFLSYARRDLPTLQPLLQDLGAHGITIWRDQDSLYGGQHWPKAIGEAIAAHDVLLLVWSQEAVASHFVEFEWNTAGPFSFPRQFRSGARLLWAEPRNVGRRLPCWCILPSA